MVFKLKTLVCEHQVVIYYYYYSIQKNNTASTITDIKKYTILKRVKDNYQGRCRAHAAYRTGWELAQASLNCRPKKYILNLAAQANSNKNTYFGASVNLIILNSIHLINSTQ